MGIRFLCPNGHKLNVKAFLAGERGICPECDAKFLVPTTSGSQATAIGAQAATEPDTTAPDTTAPDTTAKLGPEEPSVLAPPAVSAPPPIVPPVSGLPPAVAEPLPPEAWYVRTAAGDQFGPASLEVMRSWVAEARVSVDCWVWCTGWPEWKTGGQAITLLNGPPTVNTPAETTRAEITTAGITAPAIAMPEKGQSPDRATELPSATLPGAPLLGAPRPGQLPEPTTATALYRSSKHSRQQRARKVTLFLGGVVLLLIVVLVVVLINNTSLSQNPKTPSPIPSSASGGGGQSEKDN